MRCCRLSCLLSISVVALLGTPIMATSLYQSAHLRFVVPRIGRRAGVLLARAADIAASGAHGIGLAPCLNRGIPWPAGATRRGRAGPGNSWLWRTCSEGRHTSRPLHVRLSFAHALFQHRVSFSRSVETRVEASGAALCAQRAQPRRARSRFSRKASVKKLITCARGVKA